MHVTKGQSKCPWNPPGCPQGLSVPLRDLVGRGGTRSADPPEEIGVMCTHCEVRGVRPPCGLSPSSGGESRCGGINSLDLRVGMGHEKPGAPRGSLGLAGGGGLDPESADPAFSLHFRSPMSLPSTSIPPTHSAQVSVKPTCTCPGWRGVEYRFCIFLPSPPLLLAHDRWGRAGGWSQVVLDARPAAALSWLCDLGGITVPLWAFASSPAPGSVIPA